MDKSEETHEDNKDNKYIIILKYIGFSFIIF